MPIEARKIRAVYDMQTFTALLSEFEQEIIKHATNQNGDFRLPEASDTLRRGAERILAFADAIDPRTKQQPDSEGDK